MTRESFTMNFFCAVTDRRFEVTFVPFDKPDMSHIFRIFTIAKVDPALDGNADHNKTQEQEIPAERIAWNWFRCPYCEADGKDKNRVRFFRCWKCRDYICGGKVGAFRCQCRPSCGAVGMISKGSDSDIKSYKGDLTKPSAPTLPKNSSPLALPKPPGTSLIVTK